jgi:hypothetical protein
MDERFTLAARVRSFRNAFRGAAHLLRSEPNAWIHAAAALAVCVLGVLLEIPREGWLWLAAAIAGVFAAEAFNSALDRAALMDRRLVVARWTDQLAEHPQWISSDRIHLTDDGYAGRAAWMLGVVEDAVAASRRR